MLWPKGDQGRSQWFSSEGGGRGFPSDLGLLSQTGLWWNFSLLCIGEHISATRLVLLLGAVIGRDIT